MSYKLNALIKIYPVKLLSLLFIWDAAPIIAFFNGNRSVLKKISEQIDSIALSVLVIAELDYGAKASQKTKENLKKLYRFVDIVQVVPFGFIISSW